MTLKNFTTIAITNNGQVKLLKEVFTDKSISYTIFIKQGTNEVYIDCEDRDKAIQLFDMLYFVGL